MLSGCFCLVLLCVVCINRSNRVMLLEVGRIAILVECRSGKKTAREFGRCCWYFLSWSEECIQFVNNLLSYILMVKMKSLSRVWLFVTPWTKAYWAPPSMGFSGQGYWSGFPFPSPEDLPDTGIEPRSPTLQADALPSEPLGKPSTQLNLWLSW